MEINELFPNIIEETTKACSGIRHPETQKDPVPGDLIDGVSFKTDQCIVLYGDHTREEIFGIWKKQGFSKIHLSGGWSNPGLPELLTLLSLDGEVPLRERTVGDIIKAHQNGMMLKIFHDYFKAWRELFERKLEKEGRAFGKEEFEILFRKQKIGDLLAMGAPDFWELCLWNDDERMVLSKSVSNPYDGQSTEPGCINIVRTGELVISNATGSKGDGTFALNCLMVFLTNTREIARKFYVENALNRARISEKAGKTVSFSEMDIEILADEFLDSAKAIKTDLEKILGHYDTAEIMAIQYPVNIVIVKNLPQRVDPMSHTLPYCWIKTVEGWELAV
ncbi:MAG: hypothetical protein KAQ87_03645 [Candidatus Pacebacteria bacterium]|nr:hypothetical protein [Candidatus Paceibacterota bacterium]